MNEYVCNTTVAVVGGSSIVVSEYGNYKRVQLTQFDSVIVCDVNIRQAQSSYLLINGVIFYVEMDLRSGKVDHCTHNGTIKDMEDFIVNYPDQYYNLYCLDYMKSNFIRGFNKEVNRMEELKKIYTRDYKLNKILK